MDLTISKAEFDKASCAWIAGTVTLFLAVVLGAMGAHALQARLSEHLGTFKTELLEANAALMMQDADRLSALTSACAIIELALPERHPYPRLHKVFQSFLATLKDSDHWQETYIWLEMEVLAETGFGLDLTTCAATGRTGELIYVSPKSGRAVSREAGEPYHDKLLKLPAFLRGEHTKNRLEIAEILDGLRLTGYFLDHWLLAPHHRKLPAARVRLIDMMKENV